MKNKQYDISIDTEISYVSEQSLPEEGRYVFAYTITVTNTCLLYTSDAADE